MKKLLAKDGILVFTTWNFNPEKIVKNLGHGDFLLSYLSAIRYVHLFANDEIKWLIKNLNMKLLADYTDDYNQGQSNRYLVLKR